MLNRKSKIIILIVATSILTSSGLPAMAATHRVARVVSGDTIVLDDFRQVKLIGVDAPEEQSIRGRNKINAGRLFIEEKKLKEFAPKSTAHLKALCEGRQVRIVLDKAFYPIDHKDRYDRLMAYVYRHDDGLLLNEAMVRQGYALVYRRYRFERLDMFKDYERDAGRQKLGLWRIVGSEYTPKEEKDTREAQELTL